MKFIGLFLIFLIMTFVPCGAQAAETLPPEVQAQLKTPLVQMGSATFRKFGFSVYRISLWTTDGTWNKNKPYALELRYVRDVSKSDIIDIVTDDLREESVASADVVEGWHKTLESVIPDVKEGDIIASLYLPDKPKSPLFYNGKVILSTDDKLFMKAFADIWLGPTASEGMRDKLLNPQHE